MGRNREPIRLILEKGNKAHKTKAEIKERQEQEVSAPDDRIVPPPFLTTKKARNEFCCIAGELRRIGIMSNLDCDVLGRYIRSMEDWVFYDKLTAKFRKSLMRELGEDPEKDFERSETLAKYEGLKKRAFDQCQTCASSLGLTITSRCRMVVPKKDEEPKKNKYTEFIS